MKKLVSLFVFAIMVVSTNASAVLVETKIAQLAVLHDSGLVLVYVDPSIDLDVLAQAEGGENTCHDHANIYDKANTPHLWAEWGNYMSFRVDRFLGQEYMSLLSLAFAANKTVTLASTAATAEAGGCADQSYTLTLNYFKVKY